MMKQLLDVTIEEHYKELLSEVDEEERYALFYREVVKRTAKLVALWQCVGFTHGVLNTDNSMFFIYMFWILNVRDSERSWADNRLWTVWLYGPL